MPDTVKLAMFNSVNLTLSPFKSILPNERGVVLFWNNSLVLLADPAYSNNARGNWREETKDEKRIQLYSSTASIT